MSDVIRPDPHEYEAHYFFNGLGLWLAADRITSDHGGSLRGTFETNSEKWNVTLSYQESGLAPPKSGVTPGGTEIEHETIREYRLNMVREDHVGEKKVKCHIAPRWKGLQSKSGEDAAKPAWEAGDGTNVRINAANVEYERIQDLLGKAAAAVNINSLHVAEQHRREEYSTVTDAARYVRIDEDDSGPIHAREGPLARIAHLLESDRSGYRKTVQDDTKKAGYYHTVTLGPERVRKAWPDHSFPREIKHYYVEHPDAYPDSHPLSNPKLEVSYQASRWEDSLGPQDHDKIREQISESILSVLDSANLDVKPQGETNYVADAYFAATGEEREYVPALNLGRVESDQRNVVVRQLADGLAPTEWASLKTLVSDGGTVSPKDIAEDHDFHPDSIRKALRRISDMVERERGSVSLKSHYVAEQVAQAVDEAKESVSAAVETAANVLETAERDQIDKMEDELIAYCNARGINISERDQQMLIKMGRINGSEWSEIIQQLRDIWRDSRRDLSRLDEATTQYFNEETERPNLRPVRSLRAI